MILPKIGIVAVLFFFWFFFFSFVSVLWSVLVASSILILIVLLSCFLLWVFDLLKNAAARAQKNHAACLFMRVRFYVKSFVPRNFVHSINLFSVNSDYESNEFGSRMCIITRVTNTILILFMAYQLRHLFDQIIALIWNFG